MNMLFAIGLILFALGSLITFANFMWSIGGYLLWRLAGKDPKDYRAPSVISFFGSGFLWLSMPFLWQHPTLFWTALIWSIFDTGGIHWMAGISLGMLWHKRSKTK